MSEKQNNTNTNNSWADILKVSKKGLRGTIQNRLTAVAGRIPSALSTGSIFLDYVFNGGFIPGQCNHFFGPTASGKSTMCYRIISANQKVAVDLVDQGMGSLPNYLPNYKGKVKTRPVIICDAEGGLNEQFLAGCGVDFNDENFSVFYPENGEDWFTFYKRAMMAYQKAHLIEEGKDKEPRLPNNYYGPISVIDSLAAFVPKSMLDDDQEQMAFLARLLSNYLPLNCAVNSMAKATSFWVNQVRTNPMQMYGSPETTKGGQAPYFYASSNLRVSRTGQDENVFEDDLYGGEKEVKGYTLKITPKKCRWAAVTGNSYEILTIMGHGFSRISDLWNYAQITGQLKQNGAWYTLDVIGRSDLNITKNVRAQDIKNHFRENNLYEIFVMQLFSGACYGTTLTDAQLEILGAIETKGVPDIVTPEEEAALAKMTEEIKKTQKDEE